MHHIGSEELSDFHAFERKQDFAGPVRIRDIYHRFFEPQLVSVRQDWDNLSDDTFYLDANKATYEQWQLDRAKKEDEMSDLEQRAHESYNNCRKACLSLEECFQFRYHDGVCSTSKSFKHGNPAKPEDKPKDRWMSGWDVDKIKAWVDEHDECDAIEWPQ